jgi:pyruvate/2-oxoglutarate dehydrogenase complex dihydrolipoamide dehydrogenase (E3) component
VRVGELLCAAREAVVIAAGSGAAMPAISGLAEAKPWTSREVTTARRILRSLVVLGGGAVGVEMAQACSALGSTVTLLEAAERLLTREEPFAGEQLHEALVERGVDVRVGVQARAVRRDGASVTVDLSDGERVEGNEILVAVWASSPD